MDWTAIAVAAITTGLPLLAVIYKQHKSNQGLSQKLDDVSQGLRIELAHFNQMKETVDALFQATKASRFLILIASNGVKDLRFTTVIYEQHQNSSQVNLSVGASSKYVRFEFDVVYREMLKTIENLGGTYYNVAEMQPGDLKSIYESEGVKNSSVWFLRRIPINDKNHRVLYSSIATHEEKEFTDMEKIQIKAAVDKIRLLTYDFMQ